MAIIQATGIAIAIAAVASAQSGREVGAATAAAAKTASKIYIVQMLEQPVVAYDGSVAGYPATRPASGQKIDPLNSNVVRYVRYLESKHDSTLASVGGGRKLYSYKYSFNGFAAEIDSAKAARLRREPGVLAVSQDQLLKRDTLSTPEFLNLSGPGGVWEKLQGVSNAGEGIIVGIVDSGVWPESKSFSDRDAAGKLIFQQIPGWHGKCTPGEQFNASLCNQKLIGAQFFNAGYGGAQVVKSTHPYEYLSVRDADGHGTHTASTAAGNHGVAASAEGIALGTISGMAPRARVAAYKVCWGKGDDGGCFGSDSVAAIDQAVADGVDVINFSISGSRNSFLDPVEVAFLFAAQAGVVVSASAGNSGPGYFTVAHNSPWLTTVAASTHDRLYTANAILGNGSTYAGVSLTGAAASSPLVYGQNVKLAAAAAEEARLCFIGSLNPALVAGKIVVCDRGSNARTDKSLAVKQAGGVGMILVNTSPNTLNADLHYVPTVHLSDTWYTQVKDYAQTAGATASLTAGQRTVGFAPTMAAFSSRGPSLASADLLKPDITAPGVDVLAAVSPAGNNGRNFEFYSGTSMSSPHIAGISALLKQRHPTWSPAMIKSALMTTANQMASAGMPASGRFDFGAGHVAALKALDPGLVYNAGFNEWLGFLCGTGELTASYCPSISIAPSNLNYPSITISGLAGVEVVKRRVTNTGPTAEYKSVIESPAGFSLAVSPLTLVLANGQTAEYTVTATRTTAALGTYSAGSITWTDTIHEVRSPVVIRAVLMKAPAEVSSTGANITFPVKFGFSGAFGVTPGGLVAPSKTIAAVPDDPTNTFVPNGPGTKSFSVTIPAGTKLARFALFNQFTDGNDDLDLYVYNGSTLVGASGGGTTDESVSIVNPSAGTYTVYVHGWQTDGPDAVFTLFHWLVDSTPAGNMTASGPASATLGATGTVNVGFAGLAPATKYLGIVAYTGGAAAFTPTVVNVNTP